MDEWEKFNETSLTEKEDSYSNLNMEDITDADYMHAKRLCKGSEIKNFGEYHHMYLKSDTLLWAEYHGLILKKVHRVITCNQKAWVKTYVDMNTKKDFFKLMNNAVLQFWYDYVKPKYGENAKPCYMNTDSFIVHV